MSGKPPLHISEHQEESLGSKNIYKNDILNVSQTLTECLKLDDHN